MDPALPPAGEDGAPAAPEAPDVPDVTGAMPMEHEPGNPPEAVDPAAPLVEQADEVMSPRSMTAKLMTLMTLMTAAISNGQLGSNAQPEPSAGASPSPPLHTMLGPADPFDGKKSWSKWIRTMLQRLKVLRVPIANWVAVVLVLLHGPAADYAAANGITEDTPWDDFLTTMAGGPWATKDTTFSLLSRLTRGNLGNGNPVETVTQLEQIRSKLQLQLPVGFWIFVLLANLLPAFRESLLLSPSGAEWTSYDDLRAMVLSKHQAQRSASASTRDHKDSKTDSKPSRQGPNLPDRKTTGGKRWETPKTPAPRQNAGAGPSNPNLRKRKTEDGCWGCGSPSHRVGDKDSHGAPVCPLYDEAKVRKVKFQALPAKGGQGNGKGK